MTDFTVTDILLAVLILLVGFGELLRLQAARALKRALDTSAQLVALELAKSDALTRAQLNEIYNKVDGRLDLALDKVTRLETALAKERGVDPPSPNPLAMHAVQPLEE